MLRLHDTALGKVRVFKPAVEQRVTMYVCGPTVYGPPHVGNARPLVVFDILYRLLRSQFAEVLYARNITDIDDKIIAAASDKESPAELAARHERAFHAATSTLNCLSPTHQPRATEYIASMLSLVELLLERGFAYVREGHVLFDVTSYPNYGALSNRTLDQMIAGARVEVAPYKRNPGDFVLWKPASPDQPGWNSQHGYGRPGWHLECSAMIRSCLGEVIDIHGGGSDLTFPHHENETAQSCCAYGTSCLARYWLHNGHIRLAGRKMAKSEGNFSLVADEMAAHRPEVVRYALLATHYRKPLEWGASALLQATAALDRLYRALASGPIAPKDVAQPLLAELIDALEDDLNTPLALSFLHRCATLIKSGPESSATRALLRLAGNFLGLLGEQPEEWLRGKTGAPISKAAIETLLTARKHARARKDFAEADRLRDQLTAAGLELEDGPDGTTWRVP